jgi:DNA-directed RNA polymerase
MIKHLGVFNTATDLKSRRTKNTAPDLETAAVTATTAAGEKGEAEEAVLESAASPAVSVVSKEQAMQLLVPGHHELATATRKRSRSTMSESQIAAGAGAGAEDPALVGKFVDLVDLLLPVPSKGEFDVNKIKSSLYFFS